MLLYISTHRSRRRVYGVRARSSFEFSGVIGKKVPDVSFRSVFVQKNYHNAGSDSDASPAIRVRHDIAETHTKKCDRDKPHRIEQISMVLVVKPTPLPTNNY